MKGKRVDDEDSLSERLNNSNLSKDIDIAVIRLPKISNFTDFSAFSGYDNVSLRYVNNRHELGNPNLIIIPGTKSTIADLKWLNATGLEASILKLQKNIKTKYQMKLQLLQIVIALVLMMKRM